MSEIKGLYCKKQGCLTQMGGFANRLKTDNYKLVISYARSKEQLEEIGWKKISSKHLAVWDE